MKFEDIKNKKIELFVDNGIDKYRRLDTTKIKEMIAVYLENNGFFVLKDDKSDFIGYLDLADLEIIKKVIGKIKEYEDKTIKELRDNNTLTFRKESINSNTPLIDVLNKLNNSEQNYFPVLKGDIFIGRVSKRILKEKVGEFI